MRRLLRFFCVSGLCNVGQRATWTGLALANSWQTFKGTRDGRQTSSTSSNAAEPHCNAFFEEGGYGCVLVGWRRIGQATTSQKLGQRVCVFFLSLPWSFYRADKGWPWMSGSSLDGDGDGDECELVKTNLAGRIWLTDLTE